MLKVLHVLCDLAGGGAERLVLDLCRHAQTVSAQVATVHDGGALTEAFAAAGVSVWSAGRIRGGPGGMALARLIGKAEGVDVVHTHLWAGDTWGGLAARLNHTPWVRTEHNTAPDAPWRGRLTERLSRDTAKVIYVSASAARAAGEPRGLVIPNGVDLSRFSPVAPRDGPATRLLAMGRLTRQKGFDVLVAAMRSLPDLHLDIIGEGEDRPLLDAPNVQLAGWQADIRPWLTRADIAVIPSRWEGFGLVAVEAMASGVPVIASDIPALREVVGDAALLVPPSDPMALADAIRRLAADADLRRALSEAGLARVRRFDIQTTVAACEAVYRALASSPSR